MGLDPNLDPNAVLAEQLRLAHRLAGDDGTDEAKRQENFARDALVLAELVIILDEWLRKNGFLPKDWQRPVDAVRTGIESIEQAARPSQETRAVGASIEPRQQHLLDILASKAEPHQNDGDGATEGELLKNDLAGWSEIILDKKGQKT